MTTSSISGEVNISTVLTLGDLVAAPVVVADALALALVAASDAPIVLLDGDLKVVAASASFFHDFQLDPAGARGQRISELGSGEWDAPQLGSLLKATLAGPTGLDAYEMDLARPEPRRLVLSAHKLDYGDEGHVRLVLTVLDVTDVRESARIKDDLLREKGILLQELQHRVANSLQIVASILMQSARRMNSPETRGHLLDAHQRVMSVAAVQRQFAATIGDDIPLRGYFTDLCQSIQASMVRDEALTLAVTVDESLASANVSVSLGLIITELVINALKYAFPHGRGGRIEVGYQSAGEEWTLTVTDDGVGMPVDPASRAPGLGTSIVEALAKHLKASVHVADAHPGTAVSITMSGT